jgi:hypothetical protein
VSYLGQAERRFRAAPFPLYGLPASWVGGRFLGGWAAGGAPGRETTDALSLVHGDAVEGRGPTLRVETATPGRHGADGALEMFANFLWYGDAPTPQKAMALYEEQYGQHSIESGPPRDLTPLPIRGSAEIRIDGRSILFDVVLGDGVWAGRTDVDAHVVTVCGREWDLEGLSVVRIVDIDPYIDGTRRFDALIRLASRGYGPIGKIDPSALPPGPTQH